MTDRSTVTAWIDRYEQLWRTPGTDALQELFTEDATYCMAPYEQPTTGLDRIKALWERERVSADEPFTMSSSVVAVDGDTAVARIEVHYHATNNEFRDLWIMQFAGDGRCDAFEEWPFSPPEPSGR
jgi:ketosteroid isomerase-like protein